MSILEELKMRAHKREGEEVIKLVEAGKHSDARRMLMFLDRDTREVVNSYVQFRYGFKL